MSSMVGSGQEVTLWRKPMDGNVPGGLPKNTRLESGLKNRLSKKKVTQTGMSKKGIHSKKKQLEGKTKMQGKNMELSDKGKNMEHSAETQPQGTL